MTIARRGKSKKEHFTAADLIQVKPEIVVGIDPGTNTGITIYDCVKKEYLLCDTMSIINAIFEIERVFANNKGPFLITVEDSRGISGSRDKKLGAGSIRRDCAIWDDYLNAKSSVSKGIVFYRFVKPTKNPYLKASPESWLMVSKYRGKRLPSGHARDSATYIFRYL